MASFRKSVKNIGLTKQLFIDDYVIEEMKNLRKTLNQAKKHPNNPLIKSDRPWEGNLQLYGTVLYDKDKKTFRMWYYSQSGVCYAVSKDGVHWEKPVVGIAGYKGSKENNIVPNGPGEGLIYSPEMVGIESSERLYKCLNFAEGGWKPFFSSDGLHWSLYSEARPIRGSDECTIVKTHEELPGGTKAALPKYASFPKHGARVGKFPRRSVALSFSEDFIHWSEPILIFTPDELDDEIVKERIAEAKEAEVIDLDCPEDYRGEFYHMCVFPYEGIYFGFLDFFSVAAELKRLGQLNQGGPDEVQLTFSRDLIHWQRVGERKPIIAKGKLDEWDAGWQSTANFPIVVGDELWIYYYSSNTDHGGLVWKRQPQISSIGLATLRLDGFVSVDAGKREGVLTTKPLVFEGSKLVINAAAEEGSVTVEMLDEKNRAIAGFKRGDCDPFTGNNVRHAVTWHGSSDVSTLRGRPVKLRFHMKNTKLYSFVFCTE